MDYLTTKYNLVKKEIKDFYKVSDKDLHEPGRRSYNIVYSRYMMWYVLINMGFTVNDIKCCSGKDRGTIGVGVNKIKDLISVKDRRTLFDYSFISKKIEKYDTIFEIWHKLSNTPENKLEIINNQIDLWIK